MTERDAQVHTVLSAVADMRMPTESDMDDPYCPFCEWHGIHGDTPVHEPDCAVTIARSLLVPHPQGTKG